MDSGQPKNGVLNLQGCNTF